MFAHDCAEHLYRAVFRNDRTAGRLGTVPSTDQGIDVAELNLHCPCPGSAQQLVLN
jgi:hypothetical protein